MNANTQNEAAYTYPHFTKEMRATHKLLIPQMSPVHFSFIAEILRTEGYDMELLENDGPGVVQAGLQFVHNDACYPALLVIGQCIDALKSGKYDPERVGLVLTQTGGGCRASNYIHLLRKALIRAGLPEIPVLSINFSNLEKDSSLSLSLPILKKALTAMLYGDALLSLSNQVRPYEDTPGETQKKVADWQQELGRRLQTPGGAKRREMKRVFHELAEDFASVPTTYAPKVHVGVVGEIYVKYSPLANNNLVDFLISQNCKVNLPGITGFVQYCIANMSLDIALYNGSRLTKQLIDFVLRFCISRENMMIDAIKTQKKLQPPGSFMETMRLAKRFIGLGTKMGEGWLLTGEMAELIESGYENVICAQPFGCLPNHVAGRGMIAKLQSAYPNAHITGIDYDPSATRVNQENRIKLMLASALKH